MICTANFFKFYIDYLIDRIMIPCVVSDPIIRSGGIAKNISAKCFKIPMVKLSCVKYFYSKMSVIQVYPGKG